MAQVAERSIEGATSAGMAGSGAEDAAIRFEGEANGFGTDPGRKRTAIGYEASGGKEFGDARHPEETNVDEAVLCAKQTTERKSGVVRGDDDGDGSERIPGARGSDEDAQ